MASESPTLRTRRQPPPFRPVTVRATSPMSPRLLRVTLAGPALAGFTLESPAASVRLLLPPEPEAAVVIPTWGGNEFLLPDGRRPVIRTFTPRRFDPDSGVLDLDVVIHEAGAASDWARAVRPGAEAAVSGPGRGYPLDSEAHGGRSSPAFLLAGDESAIPAVSQLLEAIPATAAVRALIEVAHPDARHDLPAHPGATVEWLDLPPAATPGDALVEAVVASGTEPGIRIFAAGEAAAVQRIRRHLFDERGIARSDAWIRGYWKAGRAGTGGDDA